MESKIRILINKLEYNGGIELAHVNCKTFNPEPVMYVYIPASMSVSTEVNISSEMLTGRKRNASCDGLSVLN